MTLFKFKDQSWREEWHRWFAWYPVIVKHRMVLFEYVMRRGSEDDYGWLYKYKRIKE